VRPLLVSLLLLSASVAGATEARDFVIGGQIISFADTGATPVSWTSCEAACDDGDSRRAQWFSEADGALRWVVPGSTQATELLHSMEYAFTVNELPDATEIKLRSRLSFDDVAVNIVYRVSHSDHTVAVSYTAPVKLKLQLATGAALVPEQLPGFGAIYSTVRAANFFDGDQDYLVPDAEQPELTAQVSAEAWFGVRNRYWLWYMQPAVAAAATVSLPQANRPVATLEVPDAGLVLYAGPTELGALRAGSPELSGVLFAAIWDWLRALSFGLMYLLQWLYGLVGNYGFAIILLSLSVKILMYPLTTIADRWQSQVNAITSSMKPKLDEIKRQYKGEEAHNKVLEVYKEHKVTPFYTLRSLFGFLIQIPVFIAAFDMLAENFVLGGASFLWVADLAKPDHVFALPFALPFFGGWVNLLPFLMTALTILSAIVQEEADLTPDLMRQQRIKLFLMAGAFFLLFYTFPAGMVLYWTANNLFHLLKILPARLRAPRQAG